MDTISPSSMFTGNTSDDPRYNDEREESPIDTYAAEEQAEYVRWFENE